ncbi:MAG: MATE family efflux transporter [Paramuribaculum sp.]|nr:MATE family efflux transporter [Paramuribaculum sp.]
MLHGNMSRKIIMFAIPLIASGILQQSFNAIDVAVVGRFSSSQALAAVGSTGVIISIMINLFLGISIGANVVISNYIGQNNADGIRKAIHTAVAVALISGVLLAVTGIIFARSILVLMNTPDDVIDLSAKYLKIFFLGMPFMMMYNFGAAILRSFGDTKRPFYSLVIAGIANTVLNLILVIYCGMSVEGVAIATVAANIINATFITRWLIREPAPYTLNVKRININGHELHKVLSIGIPAGLQGMVFSTANIFIQSTINEFGSTAIAGSAAALNYELYCYFIMVAFCQAAVAFVSQNYGAGLYDRCRKAVKICMLLSVISVGVANVIIVVFDHFFIGLFSTSPEVLHYAAIRLHTVLMFQFLASSYEICGAALRALGYSMTPTLLTIAGTCVLRLIWVYTVGEYSDDFALLLSIYPITWIITGTFVVTAYLKISRKVFAKAPQPV